MGLFSVVREKLLSAGQPVTIAMFNTLFEVSNTLIKMYSYIQLHEIQAVSML